MDIDTPLDKISLEYFEMLKAQKVRENHRLEYKRQLDLSDNKEKRELPKDNSAMANASGGRIIYGLDENRLTDGSTVAGDVYPQKDGDLLSKYYNILANTVSPHLPIRAHMVDVPGGFVLVADIAPGGTCDVFMVTSSQNSGHYIRDNNSTRKMTEQEIRRAYEHIFESRKSIESHYRKSIDLELSVRGQCEESIFIIPHQYNSQLIEVAAAKNMFHKMAQHFQLSKEYTAMFCNPRIEGGGVTSWGDTEKSDAYLYLSARKNGLLHLSRRTVTESYSRNFYTDGTQALLELGLGSAFQLYRASNFSGLFHIRHDLRLDSPAVINSRAMRGEEHPVASQAEHVSDIRNDGFQMVNFFMDELWHYGGLPKWSTSSNHGSSVNQRIAKYCSYLP